MASCAYLVKLDTPRHLRWRHSLLVVARVMTVPVALIEKDLSGLKVLVFQDGLLPQYLVRMLGSLLAHL